MMMICMICENEIPDIEDWLNIELYMLCESCKKDIKSGKYGNDIIELLEEYSLEKQKAELKETLEKIEATFEGNVLFSKEGLKEYTKSLIINRYQRRHTFFGNTTNLKTKTTKNLNLHLWIGSNEKQKYHHSNYIEKHRFYQRTLKIHNEVFNDLTQKDIDKYLTVYNNTELEELKIQYHKDIETKRKKGRLKFEKDIIISHIKYHEKLLRKLNEGICPICFGVIEDKQSFIDKEINEIEIFSSELEDLKGAENND